jgi:gamma-glutamyl-gamma-aminobutyrate hydrolase PuuD
MPHDVILADDSLLARLLGAKIQVPAAHHQAPDRLGDGLTVAGWSPDDVVEALEVTGHRFGVGVHWHPEEGDDPRLLTALVEAAGASGASGQPRQDTRRRSEPQQKKPVAAKPKAGARSR